MITVHKWFNLKKKWLEISKDNEMQLIILSNSMKPNICRGDKVTIRGVVNNQVNLSDIIVFLRNEENATIHRVVDIKSKGDKIVIYTKGDANDYVDPYEVLIDDIVGVVKSITKKSK